MSNTVHTNSNGLYLSTVLALQLSEEENPPLLHLEQQQTLILIIPVLSLSLTHTQYIVISSHSLYKHKHSQLIHTYCMYAQNKP